MKLTSDEARALVNIYFADQTAMISKVINDKNLLNQLPPGVADTLYSVLNKNSTAAARWARMLAEL